MTAAISKIPGIDIATNLEEGFSGGLAGLIFDPEETQRLGDEETAEIDKQLAKLKNTRDGYILQGQAADKKAADDRKALRDKEAEEEKARLDKAAADKKAADDKATADAIANQAIIDDLMQKATLDSIEDAKLRADAELQIQRDADIAKITQAGATAEQIAAIEKQYDDKQKALDQDYANFQEELRSQDVQNALNAGSQVLDSSVSLVGEGSAVGKAAAVAQTTIDTYSSATAAYKSVVGIPVVGPALAPIAAGVAVASGVMSVKKILSTKTPGDKGGSGAAPSVGGLVPQAPNQLDPQEALASAQGNQDAGNDITFNQQAGRSQGVIKAYVVSDEMTSQQEKDAKINDLARL